MTRDQQVMQILVGLAELYKHEISSATMKMYIRALDDIPVTDIEKAAYHILKTRKFSKFPLPAEFIEFCHPPETAELIANKAWREVEDAMVMYGYVRTVGFKDPAITQTILGMGGWVEICTRSRAEGEDYNWFQKEFEKRYAQYAKAKTTDNQLLVGWSDAENIRQGFQKEPKDIAYIGFDKGEVPQIGWSGYGVAKDDGFKSIASVVAQEE